MFGTGWSQAQYQESANFVAIKFLTTAAAPLFLLGHKNPATARTVAGAGCAEADQAAFSSRCFETIIDRNDFCHVMPRFLRYSLESLEMRVQGL